MQIREAKIEDMHTIYMMGYDVWGGDLPVEDYIKECSQSIKYQKGNWFLLQDDVTGKILSSCVIYDLELKEMRVIGIGSIATRPEDRRKGYASELVRGVIKEIEHMENCSTFFLYSDIETVFYEKLGFLRFPVQNYLQSTCMYLSKDRHVNMESIEPPPYF
ncbi:GNAT family N-acetyltransferase [Metabacillus sp. HB246100]